MGGKVCVVGSFMMDLIATAPRRPLPGETLVGSGFGMHLGGKGFNQAVAAARAGADTSMVGRLGDDDFGRRFLQALDEEGIDRNGVVIDPGEGTGVGLPVVEPDGQNSIIIVPRANTLVDAEQVRAAAEQVRAADVLLLQLELPVQSALAAARAARDGGTRVVLNPAPWVEVPDELIALADVLVPNEPEAAQLLGLDVDELDAERAADGILATHPVPLVLLTLGARGVYVATGDERRMVPGHTVQVVDTVGAGDAFCGALAAALADGASVHEAAEIGNAAAALAVTQVGGAASAPTAAQTARLLDANRPARESMA